MLKRAGLLICFVCFSNPISSAAELPSWLKGWKFKGDFRVRYEAIDFDQENRDDRHRGRYRLRLGAGKNLTEKLSFGLRLASGGQATSTNESFDASFRGKDIFIDRAFLAYQAGDWKLSAGKVANPYHSTDMVWDTDVNPEGGYGQMKKGPFTVTLGGFVVEESSSSNDINLIASQISWSGGESVGFTGSIAYYIYEGFDDEDLELNGDNYTFFDVLAAIKFKNAPVPVSVNLDYVKNTTGILDEEQTAYAAYLIVGNGKKPGQWKGTLKYGHIETFSVFGLFSDSDFGFIDTEGFYGAVNYQSNKYMNWRLALYETDSIIRNEQGFTRLQFDCQIKF